MSNEENSMYKGLDSFQMFNNNPANDIETAPKRAKAKRAVFTEEEIIEKAASENFPDLEEDVAEVAQIERHVPTNPKRVSPVTKAQGYKHEEFEAITARLDYADLEILRALKSTIKSIRKQFVKPVDVKRERITENMILRSLVKCFANHSLVNQNFNWGHINTEEDLFKEISKSFKGIQKGGIHMYELVD
jgi:hypothetical protein